MNLFWKDPEITYLPQYLEYLGSSPYRRADGIAFVVTKLYMNYGEIHLWIYKPTERRLSTGLGQGRCRCRRSLSSYLEME